MIGEKNSTKRIEVIVPHPSDLRAIRVLEEMGLHFTYYNTKGQGKTPPSTVEIGRGTSTVREEFSENVTIMTVTTDLMADEVVQKILDSLRSSEGKIFVCEVNDAIDIKSKKRGDSVL